MAKKSFVTNMPDKAGAFLLASEIIAEHGGNIVRASYNKAVDLHMLFIDVEASRGNLKAIEQALYKAGYMGETLTETRVIEIAVKMTDRPGALLPVLEILNKYQINISYLNSVADGSGYQNFKLGLLIQNPRIIKTLIDEIGQIYPIDIIECDTSEENLDNTVFYIRLAKEMKELFGLSQEETRQFLAESNRILQALQSEGENAGKVFEYIRRFAYTVSKYRGENFHADVEKLALGASAVLYSIQPYCGSNTYVLDAAGELVIIDTGYAVYKEEMLRLLGGLIPNFSGRPKRVYITHADVDHCGLLTKFENAAVYVNKKSFEGFERQAGGATDYRETTELHLGYSKISRILTGYQPPDISRLNVLDKDTPAEHTGLLEIGKMCAGGYEFSIFEGTGGHLYGEMVYACKEAGVVFTGDILVNIEGFSKERAEFNSLAPFLMKSVNVDSRKATEMRKQAARLIQDITDANHTPCVVCGGHGPISVLSKGKLIKMN